jgi:hypothetical protein
MPVLVYPTFDHRAYIPSFPLRQALSIELLVINSRVSNRTLCQVISFQLKASKGRDKLQTEFGSGHMRLLNLELTYRIVMV